MEVESKGKNLDGKEFFLVTLSDGSTVECVEVMRSYNRFRNVQIAKNQDNKLEAIKEIRVALKLGLKGAKDLVEALWR